MGRQRLIRTWSALSFAAALLVGCDLLDPNVNASLKPQARPAAPASAAPVVARPTSERSASLRSYFAQVEQAQLSQGLLRQDGGGTDTPFNADTLVRNFERIAFFNEYDGNFAGVGGASPLNRWEGPVRMEVLFGDSIPPSQQRTDTQAVASYAKRLSRVTGHPVSMNGRPNFIVVIAGEDDREEMLAKAAARVPGISKSSLATVREMPRDTYCLVAAYATGADPDVYTAALAIVRSENPDLLRLSCIHEELAQGMGLSNDSPDARPSIFNDDDEFALLTRHDELLLRMLYDPRLEPGMTAAQAAPIVRTIARELTGGPQ